MKFFDRLFRRKTDRIEVARTDTMQLFFILVNPIVPPVRFPLQDDELQRVDLVSDRSGHSLSAYIKPDNDALEDLLMAAGEVEFHWRGEAVYIGPVTSRARIDDVIMIRSSTNEEPVV